MKFSIKDLVTFTEEFVNGNLLFFVQQKILTVLNGEAVSRRCNVKKVFLIFFLKFAGKYVSLFFNKVAGAARNFVKEDALAQVFSCEFWKIFKNTFFKWIHVLTWFWPTFLVCFEVHVLLRQDCQILIWWLECFEENL